jgi:glycosyltransferase involved in cell wall biosynthesis
MRVVIWHGYLLDGTGSNVYTRALARAWGAAGHEVTVVCQEQHPERYDLGGARVIRPDIGKILPVFVLDRYEGLQARKVQDLSRAELDHFVAVNADAVRQALPADLLLTNHLLLGGPVGHASGVPYVVKAHGSELEFSMRGNEALCDWARATLCTARKIIAGSAHIQRAIHEILGPSLQDQIEVIPPGVDTDLFAPLPREEALAALLHAASQDPVHAGDERLPDLGNAARLEAFLRGGEPVIVYVGKLSQEKGVHLLIEAVRRLGVKAVVVGFGPARAELEAAAVSGQVLFTGALQHRHLAPLLALAEASSVPSVFPEAFGMVAAEAASCGCPPVVARHSGLAEIAAGLEVHYPEPLRELASFPTGQVDALTDRLRRILQLGPGDRLLLRDSARQAVLARWSWASVAERLGRLART